jgi:hypothetical protein
MSEMSRELMHPHELYVPCPLAGERECRVVMRYRLSMFAPKTVIGIDITVRCRPGEGQRACEAAHMLGAKTGTGRSVACRVYDQFNTPGQEIVSPAQVQAELVAIARDDAGK